MTQLLPELINYLLLLLLGAIFALFHRWTGIQIDARHRDALQSALANGAKLLLQPGGTIDDALNYVLQSVPDALKRFRLSDDRVRELLEPHVLSLPKLPEIVTSIARDDHAIEDAVDAGIRRGLKDAVASGERAARSILR
ncbi:hypothetical protein U8330_03035 [Rhizobium sp. CC-YZS058]|nr:hypothetical protein [Rhizobium sp. CC-YZS058]